MMAHDSLEGSQDSKEAMLEPIRVIRHLVLLR
jgi:hypothetical protein